MSDYLGFVIILASGIFFSEIFKRLHLPYVIALVTAGIVIGPLGLDIIEFTPPMLFLGSIGAVFLMFMAGMEVRTDILTEMQSKLMIIAFMNGAIPAIVGFAITILSGYDLIGAVVVGTIFVSSSIAVIIPSLEAKGLISSDIGTAIVGATIIEDMSSLFLLSIVLQTMDPTSPLPLHIFLIILVLSVIGLKILLPKIEAEFFKRRARKGFEEQLQFIFLITIGVAAYFELLGVHAIIAGFLVGLMLCDSAKQERIQNKLHTLSYGVFIPIFFLQVGAETDLTVFFQVGEAAALTIAITAGLIIAKLVSGYAAGRLVGFSGRKSLLIGAASIPQLSTSLVAAFTALEMGLLDPSLQVSIVFLSIVTVLLAPFLVGSLTRNQDREASRSRSNTE